MQLRCCNLSRSSIVISNLSCCAHIRSSGKKKLASKLIRNPTSHRLQRAVVERNFCLLLEMHLGSITEHFEKQLKAFNRSLFLRKVPL